MPLYYTIEKKEDSQSAEWEPLTDHKIDPEEASYLSKFHFMYSYEVLSVGSWERNPLGCHQSRYSYRVSKGYSSGTTCILTHLCIFESHYIRVVVKVLNITRPVSKLISNI